MKAKRASVEIQFNWIFVVIIGALILGFFFSLVNKQGRNVEQKSTYELLSKIDAILMGSFVSSNVFQKIEIPGTKVEFIYPDFKIESRTWDLRGKFVFAPSSLSGDFLAASTKTWNVGFDVVNFVYLTNSDVKYYFVPGSQTLFAEKINSSIEKRIEDDAENLGDLVRVDFLNPSLAPTDEGYSKTRFIFFGSNPNSGVLTNLENKPNKDISALKINGNEKSGTLTFYKKSGNDFVQDGTEIPYIGSGLLYGAIFVDNYDTYEYLFNKALKKLYVISEIYRIRSEKLLLEVPSCAYPNSIFADISSHVKTYLQDSTKTSEIQEIASQIDTLEEQRLELYYAGCPIPY